MPRAQFSRAADRDLIAIWRYGAEKFGLETAQRYARRIDVAVATLLDFPRSGGQVPGRDIRRLAVERHVIYYRPTTEGIFVIRVLHQRMDAERHL